MALSPTKRALRQRLRAIRTSLSDRPTRSSRAAAHLLASEAWRAADCVALFVSIGSEISTRPLLEAAWGAGKQVALPLIIGPGQPLEFRQAGPETPLIEGSMGVLEPHGTRRLRPTLVVVPGLAFDAAGGRLGYGGGYYDRTLASLGARRMMLAFEAQRVPSVPMEADDIRVHAVVTEEGIRWTLPGVDSPSASG